MIKVAGYCRVSTDKNDQINSFEAQRRFFLEYIEHSPDWELYKVYADEGITGTSTNKRTQFNCMIADAYEGKFEMIMTKEVSRFSRNILDTIAYTRRLKDLGIGVRFLLDGIDTMKPDAELYLSIMASLAQEESRKTSSRVVWGQTRQMEKGVVFGHSLLGYDVKDGRITINPEGAFIIQQIFRKYTLEQIGTSEIAKYLSNEGYSSLWGNTKWNASTIVRILSNEKYVGDLVQKKSYTPNFLTHAKKRNCGEVEQIRIENHHEPIISREMWNLAQERLRKNNKHSGVKNGHSNRYVFSGKIKCGQCGSSFVSRYKYLKDGTKVRRWCCGTTVAMGAQACSVGKLLRDDNARLMLKKSMNCLRLDLNAIARNVTMLALDAIWEEYQSSEGNPKRIQSEIDYIIYKKNTMLDNFFSGEISKADMLLMKQGYENKMNSLLKKLDEINVYASEYPSLKERIQSRISLILNGEEGSDIVYKTILQGVTVFKDRHMELRFCNLPHIFYFQE